MSIRRNMAFPSLRLLISSALAILWFTSCVDTTPPWDKVKPLGTGGLPGTGGGGGQVIGTGGQAIDGAAGTGGAREAGAGGAIDVGLDGAGGAQGGAGGTIDAPMGGGGSIDVGAGGSGIDVPSPGSGGAGGGIDGAADVPLGGAGGGTGGTSRTGGAKGTGGARTGGTTGTGGARTGGASGTGGVRTGGASGTGGTTTTGGATGTGGATTPDAGPDVQPDATTLVNGLVAYYKCDETSGSTLLDSSGNNRHGTLGIGTIPDGGPAPSGSGYSFAAGKVGNALILTRAGYGHASLPPAIFNGVGDITVATWVWVTDPPSNWQRIFDVGVKPTSYLFVNTPTETKYMNLTPKNIAGNIRWSITSNGYDNEESLNTASLATGTWKHLAVVLTGGNGYLYVDGAQAVVDPTVLTPAGLGTIDYAYLGRSQFDADPYFDGKIDEFRVYNRALSATEIQALYQFTGP